MPWSRRIVCAGSKAGFALSLGTTLLLAMPIAAAEILVRLRAEGPAAVTACAEHQQRMGRPMAQILEDGSESLDRLHAELGVRRVRAVFRRSDGRSFQVQRAALRARATRPRARLPGRARLPDPPDLAHVYRVALPPGANPAEAARRYAADSHVVWAQPNFEGRIDFVADDPFLASSGAWGQDHADLWGLDRIRAPEAWTRTRGEGVLVAVVDTGLDTEHPDLVANVWVNPGEDLDGSGRIEPDERNGVDDDGNGFVDDFHGFDFANSIDANDDGDFDDPEDVSDSDPFDDWGHGTHVAGTVAAVGGNGVGVAGVAPRATVMGVKVFPENEGAPVEVLARGVAYALWNGARVVNNSWSCGQRCPENPVIEEVVALAESLGAVIVTSAGNRSDDVLFYSPENRRETIAVGASGLQDETTAFSSRGLLMDLLAPGGADPLGPGFFAQRAILSTRSSGANDNADGAGAFTVAGEYLRWVGTSMSAPHVAGTVALLLADRPALTPEEVRGILRASARDVGAPGHDAESGAGVLDAAVALETDPPAAGARFTYPLPGAVVVLRGDTLALEGEVFGDDVFRELAVGRGLVPSGFEVVGLRAGGRATDGVLAEWPVGTYAPGSVLFRLTVRGSDGREVVEYLPFALEHQEPVRLSSPGQNAEAPDLSGAWVAWQSRRNLEEAPDEDLGSEIFVTAWGPRNALHEWRAVSGPGDQNEVRLAGRRLAWFDDRAATNEVHTCRIRRIGGACDAQAVAAGEAGRQRLTLSRRFLVWTAQVGGLQRLLGCQFTARGCAAWPMPDTAGRQTDPVLSRRDLLWTDWSGGFPATLRCRLTGNGCAQPEPVPAEIPAQETDLAGSLVAWRDFADRLVACHREADGRCEPAVVATGGIGRPRISGRRITWSGVQDGNRDVYVCEYDRDTRECPVQRLTGAAGDQDAPDVSGARVVWEDDRAGGRAIFGARLPEVLPLPPRTVRTGRLLWLRVRAHGPERAALTLHGRFADGSPLSSRGIRLRDRGDGRGWLAWRPGPGDVGAHHIVVEARTAGGLFSRRTWVVQVEPGRAWKPGRVSRPRGSR